MFPSWVDIPRDFFGNYSPACFSYPRKSESDLYGAATVLRSSQRRGNKSTMENVMRNERSKMRTITEAPVLRRMGPIALAALSASKTAGAALALVLLASQALAVSFSFSTGDPDGKIATLSRP